MTFPFRAGVRVGATSSRVSYRTARYIGFRRTFLLGLGIAIGLLIAPVPGKQLRATLKELKPSGGPDDLGERVRFELSHDPSTWDLPQPSIAVDGSRVILRGLAPHATARLDLERAAITVPGVNTVENLIEISGTNGAR